MGCNCKGIHERVLEENFLAVLNVVIENKDLVVKELTEFVRKTIAESSDKSSEIKAIMTDMAKMGTRKSKLLDLHVDGVITRAEFDKANSQYNKQLDALESQLLALEHDNKLIVNLT